MTTYHLLKISIVMFNWKRLVASRGIEAFRVDFDTIRPGHMVNQKVHFPLLG
jgi:sporulation-control protein spo0M